MEIVRHESGAYVLRDGDTVLKAFGSRREAVRGMARVALGQPPCVGCGPISKSSPPASARAEAKRGLEWRREHGRGGTAVGIARARDIARGAELPASTIKRMVSFFARHEVDKKGKGWSPGEPGYPSNGRIAWALWGGDAGRSWANSQSSVSKSGEKEGHQFRGNQYTGGKPGPQKPKAPKYVKQAESDAATGVVGQMMGSVKKPVGTSNKPKAKKTAPKKTTPKKAVPKQAALDKLHESIAARNQRIKFPKFLAKAVAGRKKPQISNKDLEAQRQAARLAKVANAWATAQDMVKNPEAVAAARSFVATHYADETRVRYGLDTELGALQGARANWTQKPGRASSEKSGLHVTLAKKYRADADAVACYLFAATMQTEWAEDSGGQACAALKMAIGGDTTWKKRLSPLERKNATALYKAYGAAFDALSESVYSRTQEALSSAGIKSLPLYRGMYARPLAAYGSREAGKQILAAATQWTPRRSHSPTEAQAYDLGWGDDGAYANDPLFSWEPTQVYVGKAKISVVADPLSSWADVQDRAMPFMSSEALGLAPAPGDLKVMLKSSVPASKVWSLADTGFGCLEEREIVLRDSSGSKANATMWMFHDEMRAWGDALPKSLRPLAGMSKGDGIYIDFPGLGGRDWPKRTKDVWMPDRNEVHKAGEREGHQFRGNQYTGGRKGPQKPKPPPYAAKVKGSAPAKAGKQPDEASVPQKPKQQETATGVVGNAKTRAMRLKETRAKTRDARQKKLKNEVVREKEGVFTSYKGDGPLTTANATPEQLAYAQKLRNNVLAGRSVEVSEQGATILIDELAKFGAEEYKKSKADPSYQPRNIDLCRITIKGTNSFCEGNTGRERSEMPQLAGDYYETWPEGHPDAGQKTPAALFAEKHGNDTGPDGKPLVGTDKRTGQRELKAGSAFEEAMKAKGIRVTPGVKYKASDLRASQAELNGGKVTGIMGTILEGVRPGSSDDAKAKLKELESGTIYVSNDGYIIDGHHRWAATVAADFMMDGKPGDLDVNVTVIDLPIEDALQESSWFSQAFGIKGKSAKETVKKMLKRIKRLIAKGVPTDEAIVIVKSGERQGHPFRGNQYTRGIPGRGSASGVVGHMGRKGPMIVGSGDDRGTRYVHHEDGTKHIGSVRPLGSKWAGEYLHPDGSSRSTYFLSTSSRRMAQAVQDAYDSARGKKTGVVGQSRNIADLKAMAAGSRAEKPILIGPRAGNTRAVLSPGDKQYVGSVHQQPDGTWKGRHLAADGSEQDTPGTHMSARQAGNAVHANFVSGRSTRQSTGVVGQMYGSAKARKPAVKRASKPKPKHISVMTQKEITSLGNAELVAARDRAHRAAERRVWSRDEYNGRVDNMLRRRIRWAESEMSRRGIMQPRPESTGSPDR